MSDLAFQACAVSFGKVILLNPHHHSRKWALFLFLLARWGKWTLEVSNTSPRITESVCWDSVINVCLCLEFPSALGKPRAQKPWWIWFICAVRVNCSFPMCPPFLRHQHHSYLGLFSDLPYFLPVLSQQNEWTFLMIQVYLSSRNESVCLSLFVSHAKRIFSSFS